MRRIRAPQNLSKKVKWALLYCSTTSLGRLLPTAVVQPLLLRYPRMSGDIKVLRLFQQLAPDKSAKWEDWAAKLQAEDIDTAADVFGLSEDAFGKLPLSVLVKDILRKFRDESSEVCASDLEIVVVCEKGLYQRGPINRCLALKKSFKRQFATIDASRIPMCFHVTNVQGAEPKEADVIKLVGAEIDRAVPFDSGKPTRANAPRPSLFQPTGQHVFRINPFAALGLI